MGLTGTGSGACWAETVHRGSRDIFLDLFGKGKQEQDLIEMNLFINTGELGRKIQIDDIMDIKGELWLTKLSKVTFLPFIQVADNAQSIQTGLRNSLWPGLWLPCLLLRRLT